MKTTPFTVNPFTDSYWESEIQSLGLKKTTFHMERIEVSWFKLAGRCDDYLNSNIRFNKTKIPRLIIDNKTWMSLTPMEIQSAALAIHRAVGHVVTLGLGLGYYTMRAAAKPEVSLVTVFEKDPLVIEWFQGAYAGRPELAKVKIIEGDARKLFQGVTCDFVFSDIYEALLPDEALTDVKLFRRNNSIGSYHYWGLEKAVLEMITKKIIGIKRLMIGEDMYTYFRFWQDTPFDDKNDTTLGQLYHEQLDTTYLRKAARQFTDYPI